MTRTFHRLARLLLVELIKWKSHPFPWIACLGTLVFIFLVAITLKSVGSTYGFECYRVCFQYGLWGSLAFAMVAACSSVAGERELKTLHAILPRPCLRHELLLAKVVIAVLFATLLLALVCLGSLLVSQQLFRLVDVRLPTAIIPAEDAFAEIWSAALFVWAPYVTLAVTGVAVSCFCQNVRVAVATGLGAHAVSFVVSEVAQQQRMAARLLLPHWIDLRLERMESVFRAKVFTGVIDGERLVLTCLLYCAAAFLIGGLAFRYRDVRQ